MSSKFDPGKSSTTRVKNGVFALSKVKKGPNRAKMDPKVSLAFFKAYLRLFFVTNYEKLKLHT